MAQTKDPDTERRLVHQVRIEQLKLRAGFVNTLGLGIIGLGAVRPLIDPDVPVGAPVLWAVVVGLAMHLLARYILEELLHHLKGELS